MEHEAGGRPIVRGPFREDLRVSVAHKEGMAVALAAEGRDVGIDVERISARPEGFAELALTGSERALVAGASQDEWLTRVWVAKEAVAKARGTGLRGDPRQFEVSHIDGERLLVDSMWVETRIDGELVVGWTAT